MWLMLIFLALPLIEIALFVLIGGSIGLWMTLAWVVLAVVLGVFVLKRVSRLGPISYEQDVQSLRDPSSPAARRALTILAAVLLIVPGFFTDAAGLLLLLAPVQALIIRLFSGRARQDGAGFGSATTIDGDWSEIASTPEDEVTVAAQPTSDSTRH